MNASTRTGQPTFRSLPLSPAGQPNRSEPQRASLSDRRTSLRGPVQTKAKLTVLDGPAAGHEHEILTRDQSLSGISFLLRECLSVGQECRIQFEGPSQKAYLAEVVRSRGISAGRYEMAVQFRKQV